MKKPQGIVLYKGPSMIDGRLIVAIATGIKYKTDNEKIGDMIPVYIMRPDIPPIAGTKLGWDISCCGNCKHRDFRSCYVNLCHGPENVFKAYHNDKYIPYSHDVLPLFEGKNIRLGAWGDPAAVPVWVWDYICGNAKSYTGYTHQWNNKKIDTYLKSFCMASCDLISEQRKAQSLNWRTFRIRMIKNEETMRSPLLMNEHQILPNEFVCPASEEGGRKTTCDKCKACMGIMATTKKNSCILVHGANFKIQNFITGIRKVLHKKQFKINFRARYQGLTA